jgi:deoxyxylulose-5-phosphate synthase
MSLSRQNTIDSMSPDPMTYPDGTVAEAVAVAFAAGIAAVDASLASCATA